MFDSIAIVIKGLSWANPFLMRRKWNNQIMITIKTFIWVLVSDTFKTYQNQPRKSLFGVFFFESCYWLYGEGVRRRWSKSGSGKKPSLQWHSGSLTWKFNFERGSLLHQYSWRGLTTWDSHRIKGNEKEDIFQTFCSCYKSIWTTMSTAMQSNLELECGHWLKLSLRSRSLTSGSGKYSSSQPLTPSSTLRLDLNFDLWI